MTAQVAGGAHPIAHADEVLPRFPRSTAALLVAVQFGLGLNLFAASPLLPMASDDYDISNTVASLLVAGPVLLQAFAGLPGSLIVSRWGARRTLIAGAAMVSLSVVLPWAPSFGAVLAVRLVCGLGVGLAITGTAPFIKGRFARRHIPLMNTLFLVALAGGIALSLSLAAPLAIALGWETALAVFGAAMVVPTVAWWFTDLDVVAPSATRLFDLTRVRRVMSDRTIAGLVIADALVFVQYAVLTTWLPTFLSEDRDMSLERAGLITGLLPAVGIAAVIAGGFISYRFQHFRVMIGSAGLLVGVSGFTTFLVPHPVAIVVSIIALGIGTWVYQPAFHTVPMQLPWMTSDNIAVVWGASMTIAGVGQFVGPIIVGAFRDRTGSFVPGFIVFAVLAWSLPLVAALLTEPDSSSSFTRQGETKT